MYLSSMEPHYEFLEHTADILVKGYGRSRADAFAQVAEALFAVITDSAPVTPNRRDTLHTESIDLEGLLIEFLSDLIVYHETNNAVMTDFRITFNSPFSLTAEFGVESFDTARHGQGNQVKGVSYHQLEMIDGSDGCSVQVLFDV